MVSKKKKRQQNRRILSFAILGISALVVIGIFTADRPPEPVVELYHQAEQFLVFYPTPLEFIGEHGQSLSTLCQFDLITYYITSQGDRIQGSLTFQKVFQPPFVAEEIVSRATGHTITAFEHDVFLTCKQREGFESFDMEVVRGQARNVVIVDDHTGVSRNVFEVFDSIAGVSSANPITLLDNKQTKVATFRVNANQIERDLPDTELAYDSTIRFVNNVDMELTIDDVLFSYSGSLATHYKVEIQNDQLSATPREPKVTDISLNIISPSDKVIAGENVRFDFEIAMTDWDETEGFPTLTIQDFRGQIIFTKDIPPTGAKRDVTLFRDGFLFPGKQPGQYKISASVPAFRPITTQYIQVLAEGVEKPKEPSTPTSLVDCPQGFIPFGGVCVQAPQQAFFDPTQLSLIAGQTLNVILPIIVVIIIIIVIIGILQAVLRRRGGFGGRTVIRLNGRRPRAQKPTENQVLPRGLGKRTPV